jgi:hypothetical protein
MALQVMACLVGWQCAMRNTRLSQLPVHRQIAGTGTGTALNERELLQRSEPSIVSSCPSSRAETRSQHALLLLGSYSYGPSNDLRSVRIASPKVRGHGFCAPTATL